MDCSNPLAWLEDRDPSKWEEEPLYNYQDGHKLYRVVDKSFWAPWPDLTKIYPNFFTFNKKAFKEYDLSVDWSKYATPAFSFNNRNKKQFGLMEFNVGDLKNIISVNNLPISLKHTPIRCISDSEPRLNKSHTDIKGFKPKNCSAIRLEISLAAQWTDSFRPVR